MTVPVVPPEDITFLEPFDWLETYLSIFKNDTDYGFENRTNPDLNVFKQYNAVQSLPKTIGQMPALWVACEGFESLPGERTPIGFLTHFQAYVDIYMIVHRGMSLQYDDKMWTVPSSEHSPEPENNLLFLLIEYVGRKIEDNILIETADYSINQKAFIDGEFFYDGFQGNADARAVRIGISMEVERE